MKCIKKISVFLLALVAAVNTFVFSVSADYTSPYSIWNSIASSGALAQIVTGWLVGKVCPKSPDSYHHATTYDTASTVSSYYLCICDYCGQRFRAYESDLRNSYNSNGSTRGNGYYTEPTNTVVDDAGNTTNYYRSGNTTKVSLVNTNTNSFNTINNTSYTTNNSTYNSYKANVDLSNFLNQYTYNYNTYNYELNYTNYVYNTTNNYYYVTIDASTTNNYEYNYDIEVTYSPQYTTVQYISNNSEVNNVTNVYYYALYDGRNSYDISADEINGLATDYTYGNYDLVIEDEDTLSLQHFDGNYDDSSAYGRTRYDGGTRSQTYVDDGDFGQAVSLDSGFKAGVYIPELSSYDTLSFDMRVNVDSLDSLGIFLGDTCVFERLRDYRQWNLKDIYDDNETYFDKTFSTELSIGSFYSFSEIGYTPSTTLSDEKSIPDSGEASGYIYPSSSNYEYGYMSFVDSEVVFNSKIAIANSQCLFCDSVGSSYDCRFKIYHYDSYKYLAYPSYTIAVNTVNFPVSTWVTLRIVISDGMIYYFINGDLAGSDAFSMPDAEYFYVESSGTVLLDELRISTGNLVSKDTYDPPLQPFDTNKVLARPSNPENGKIYIRSNITCSALRVGGVRPSAPSSGFCYIPLDSNYTGVGCQIYDGSNWQECDAYIYENDTWSDVLGYRFYTVSDYGDISSGDDSGDDSGDVDPSPSPAGGDGGSDNDSGDDGSSKSIWDRLADAIVSLFEAIGKVAGGIGTGIVNLLTKAVDSLSSLGGIFRAWSMAFLALAPVLSIYYLTFSRLFLLMR